MLLGSSALYGKVIKQAQVYRRSIRGRCTGISSVSFKTQEWGWEGKVIKR